MADELTPRDEDRLPWLETVAADGPAGPPIGRMIAFVILGLVVLAGLIYGVYRFQHRSYEGNGQLIAAPAGDYKVKPVDPGGLKVEGEGQSAIAASAGSGAGNGAIDLNAVSETPVVASHPTATATATATATSRGSRNIVAEVPELHKRLVAAAPVTVARAPAAGASGGGALVQLGAYPSAARADTAWATFSKRFGYLAPLTKLVQPVATGGNTLYRLRVDAGSANAAADICGRLRVAGESCFVAS